MILLLLAPILPSPTPENVINGINGIYLKSIIVLSSIANSAHIITQIILLAAFNYSTSIDYCTNIGKIMNLIGLHRYNDLSFFNIIRLCCMDFIVLLITCLVLAFSSHTYHSKLDTSIGDNITNVSVIRKKTNTEKLKNQSIHLFRIFDFKNEDSPMLVMLVKCLADVSPIDNRLWQHQVNGD